MSISACTSNPGTVPDPKLCDWIDHGNGEERGLIVEVRLPPRRVALEGGNAGQRGFAHHILGGDREGRGKAIAELAGYLEHDLGLSAKKLNTAGAIVVSATPSQVRRFLGHPLVKAVRLNRRLMS